MSSKRATTNGRCCFSPFFVTCSAFLFFLCVSYLTGFLFVVLENPSWLSLHVLSLFSWKSFTDISSDLLREQIYHNISRVSCRFLDSVCRRQLFSLFFPSVYFYYQMICVTWAVIRFECSVSSQSRMSIGLVSWFHLFYKSSYSCHHRLKRKETMNNTNGTINTAV